MEFLLICLIVIIVIGSFGVVNDYYYEDGFFKRKDSESEDHLSYFSSTGTLPLSGTSERAELHELEQQLDIPMSIRVDPPLVIEGEPLQTSRPAQLEDATWVDFDEQDELSYVPPRDSSPQREPTDEDIINDLRRITGD